MWTPQIAIIVISVFVILAATYLLTLRVRRKKKRTTNRNNSTTSTTTTTPTSSRGPQLPSFSRWILRKLNVRKDSHSYSSTLQENELDRAESREPAMTADPERRSEPGVDRNTSVRSVMTLPAYSPAARENERILAREGERAGIDTVIEFPENVDEEEARREEEMESLYQIRLARRQEAAEREERRRLRREARARGDTQALAELRRQAELANELSTSQILIAEHQSANRERRVSSVQYGDLGVARHDGTRLRAGSTESDRRPLLDSAASISEFSQRSGRSGRPSTLSASHNRIPSSSSMLSMETRASDEFEFPQAHFAGQHHRTGSQGTQAMTEDYEVISLSQAQSYHSHSATHSRNGSRTASPFPPLEIPTEEPPTYDAHAAGFEEAPPYESPVRNRAPQLPGLERLPSIRISTEPDHGGESGNGR